MSSAEDLESEVGARRHDDRLARAFDRAARLGIDVDDDQGHDDGLSERESAAVRAFAALRRDDEPEPHPEPGPPAGDAFPPDPAPGTLPRFDRFMTADDTLDDRPLRPDAVLHTRRLDGDGLASGDRWHDGDTSHATQASFPPRPSASTTDTWAPPPTSPTTDTHPPRPAATTGTRVPPPPSSTDTRPTSPATDSPPPSRAVDRHLLDVLAVAVATGAYVSPWAWLSIVTAAAAAGVVVRSATDHGTHAGAMVRRGLRRALRWLRPRSAVWFLVLVARTALLGVMIPAVVCSIWWIAQHGTAGALSAARSGAWDLGLRTAAAVVCFMLVAGVGEARSRRAGEVREVAAGLGTATVVAVAAGAVLVAVLVVAVVPRADSRQLGADGLGWVPARLRDNVDRLRDEVVAAELHATTGCLSERQGVTWEGSHTAANPLDEDDVARLTVEGEVPALGDLATAAAAAHNQLAPWVETIELRAGDLPLASIDRTALPSGPLVDPSRLVTAADPGAGAMAEGIGGFDRGMALACASAPVP